MKHAIGLKVGAALVGMALVVAACGGGGGGGATAGAGKSQVAGTASGTLSAFGSVIVNGREFDDSAATVMHGDDDDAPGSRTDLQVGMVVDVDHEPSGGREIARRIRFASVVKGQVESIDATNGRLTVLGQTVLVSGGTVFSGTDATGAAITDLNGLTTSDFIAVYGFVQATGEDVATLIVKIPYVAGTTRVKAEGVVQNLNATASTFNVNALVVDFSKAVCAPSPCSALTGGAFVEVRSATLPTAGVLVADRVRVKRQLPATAAGESIEIEGPASGFDAARKTFVVRGVEVDASAVDVTGVSNGAIVEVDGTLADGVLTATKLSVEHPAVLRVEADVDTVQGAPANTITLLGATVRVNAATHFDDRVAHTRPFNADNFASVLMPHDHILVSGYRSGAGIVATRVQRIKARPVAALEGILEATTPPTGLTVGGIPVTVGASTRYLGAADAAGFFGGLTVGRSVVVVKGVPGAAGTIDATAGSVLALPRLRWRD